MRWIPVTERLPEGADAISCEAWCGASEPGEVAGPCVMMFDPTADEGDRWSSREDTGCWEPGPVTHWRSRPEAPWQEDLLMGVIGADGKKHCLFSSRAEEDAAVARSPLKVVEDLMALAQRVGALLQQDTPGVVAAPAPEVTDAMVDAYLQANDAYWKRTDELPTPPNKWRTGTPREATRESLRAALGVGEVKRG